MIDSARLPALFEPRRPLRAILIGWPLASVPALALAMLASLLLSQVSGPTLPMSGLAPFIAVVLFAPVVETLIMAAAIELLLLARMPPRFAIIGSAVGWAIAHSLIAPAWGLVIWWPFLIFSTLYVTWRGQGRALAIAIVFAVHALNNLAPALLLLRSA